MHVCSILFKCIYVFVCFVVAVISVGSFSNLHVNRLVASNKKVVLRGHGQQVNWACFHPTRDMIASGGDDNSVKVWTLNSKNNACIFVIHQILLSNCKLSVIVNTYLN